MYMIICLICLIRTIFLHVCAVPLAGLSTDGSSSPSEKAVNVMTEVRALQEIIAKFKSLQVDATEYACLKGIVLFKTGMFSRLFIPIMQLFLATLTKMLTFPKD